MEKQWTNCTQHLLFGIVQWASKGLVSIPEVVRGFSLTVDTF